MMKGSLHLISEVFERPLREENVIFPGEEGVWGLHPQAGFGACGPNTSPCFYTSPVIRYSTIFAQRSMLSMAMCSNLPW